MRYVLARLDEYNREEAYRIYVTRSLQLIPQTKCLQKSYLEILNESESVKDTRSGDQVALDIIQQAGLKLKE